MLLYKKLHSFHVNGGGIYTTQEIFTYLRLEITRSRDPDSRGNGCSSSIITFVDLMFSGVCAASSMDGEKSLI